MGEHETCREEEGLAHCPGCGEETLHVVHVCEDKKTSRCTVCGHTASYLEP